MKDISKFFSSLCHRHCWLSRIFHRTQICLSGLEKQSLLCMPFDDEKVTQFSSFPPTSVSYLDPIPDEVFWITHT